MKIKPQIFKTANGERPITYGVWFGETFLCWSWTFCGAMKAATYLRGNNFYGK